ncbi:hypothetical protein SAMN05720472_1611 [Fibrobacter sp. UWR3]|uniref:hypothetical protein n=1 Tax=Fibrobacter sp. UWR3 TaxID=1896217 RepID=UPI0009187405|nr:hypothetical protein [Fibrobacter sp. UWR3]SHM55202.1 hypothetical protein SAMN05720472_1611 [Fibrobacter sp. UWR3]
MINKKFILISFLINLYFLGLCIAFGDLRFDAIDDIFMSGILSGIYGEGYNVHLTFVNALYGYCLLPLYHLFPKINWYYIGEMASVFVSLTIVGYIVVNKVGEKWGAILTVVIVALCASDFYLAIQFTKCAAMLSATGMLAFIYGLEKKATEVPTKNWITLLILGVLLLWWGSWMRWEAFLMGMPFFAAALLLLVKKLWNVKLTVIVALAIVFVGAYGFQFFNKSLYQAPDYKKYMEFQGPRALLGDGLFYNQQAVDEDLDEISYSGQALPMLTHWLFYDTEVFAPDSLRIITNLIAKYKNEMFIRPQLANVLGTLPNSAKYPVFIIWLLLCFALFAFKSPQSLWSWLSLLIVCAMIAYLLYLQRLVYRVEVGLWLYAALLTIPFLKERFQIHKSISIGFVCVVAIITLCSYAISGPTVRHVRSGEIVPIHHEHTDTVDYKGLFAFMDSVPDSTVFVMEMNSYMSMSRQKVPPYLTEPQGSWEQVISFGFWTPYFPDVEKAIHKRGVTNPMKDVVLDNVFVVDVPTLGNFLEQHYYNKVKVDTVHNFNGMVVYKYSLVNDSLTETGK